MIQINPQSFVGRYGRGVKDKIICKENIKKTDNLKCCIFRRRRGGGDSENIVSSSGSDSFEAAKKWKLQRMICS